MRRIARLPLVCFLTPVIAPAAEPPKSLPERFADVRVRYMTPRMEAVVYYLQKDKGATDEQVQSDTETVLRFARRLDLDRFVAENTKMGKLNVQEEAGAICSAWFDVRTAKPIGEKLTFGDIEGKLKDYALVECEVPEGALVTIIGEKGTRKHTVPFQTYLKAGAKYRIKADGGGLAKPVEFEFTPKQFRDAIKLPTDKK